MKIRKAAQKDVDIIIGLWQDFMDEHDRMSLKADKRLKPHIHKKPTANALVKKFFKSNIHSKQGNIFVAEHNKEIIGYCLAYVKANIPIYSASKLGYISDMYIKRGYRKMGIATKLKNAAKKWFKSLGLKYMSIAYYTVNKRAKSVYRKWGFSDLHAEMRKKI